jgi:hypothetical protein
MTTAEFAEAVVTVRRRYQGRVRSWGRSAFFKIGFPDDPHEWDLAVDMIYPTGPNRLGSEDHPRMPHSCPFCSEEGLKAIHEKDHDHYQPRDFPAGPTKQYAGIVKDWA